MKRFLLSVLLVLSISAIVVAAPKIPELPFIGNLADCKTINEAKIYVRRHPEIFDNYKLNDMSEDKILQFILPHSFRPCKFITCYFIDSTEPNFRKIDYFVMDDSDEIVMSTMLVLSAPVINWMYGPMDELSYVSKVVDSLKGLDTQAGALIGKRSLSEYGMYLQIFSFAAGLDAYDYSYNMSYIIVD
jgi:hypothetical protein